jgi:hypothetical protein
MNKRRKPKAVVPPPGKEGYVRWGKGWVSPKRGVEIKAALRDKQVAAGKARQRQRQAEAAEHKPGERRNFAQEIMEAYASLPPGTLAAYAKKNPGNFLERWVVPIAVKQLGREDPEKERQRHEQETEEDLQKQQEALEEFNRAWAKRKESPGVYVGTDG